MRGDEMIFRNPFRNVLAMLQRLSLQLVRNVLFGGVDGSPFMRMIQAKGSQIPGASAGPVDLVH